MKEEKEEIIPYNWTTLPTGKYKNEWKIPDKKDMQEIKKFLKEEKKFNKEEKTWKKEKKN